MSDPKSPTECVDLDALRARNNRAINVEVPDRVYWWVRECAVKSRCSMKEYVTRFCLHARPLAELPAPPELPPSQPL